MHGGCHCYGPRWLRVSVNCSVIWMGTKEHTAGPVEKKGADGFIEPGEVEVGLGSLSPLRENFVKDGGRGHWELLLLLGLDELCGDAGDRRGRGAADGRSGEHARAEGDGQRKGGKVWAGEETGAGEEEHRWESDVGE